MWGKSWYNNDDKSCAWTLNTLINFFNYTYSFRKIYLYHLLFQLSQTWCILLRLTALASCFTSIVLWIYVFMSSILWFDINVSIYSISLFSFLYFYEVLRRIICRICMRYQKYIKLEQIEAIQPQTKHITAFAKLNSLFVTIIIVFISINSVNHFSAIKICFEIMHKNMLDIPSNPK